MASREGIGLGLGRTGQEGTGKEKARWYGPRQRGLRRELTQFLSAEFQTDTRGTPYPMLVAVDRLSRPLLDES